MTWLWRSFCKALCGAAWLLWWVVFTVVAVVCYAICWVALIIIWLCTVIYDAAHRPTD